MNAVDAIAALFDGAAMQSYLGEAVSLADHMLQAAGLAHSHTSDRSWNCSNSRLRGD